MSKLVDFFKKKILDSKFKKAGSGQRLCDETKSRDVVVVSREAAERQAPSESAMRAGEAALSRLNVVNTKVTKNPAKLDGNLETEILMESKELQKAYEFKDRACGKVIDTEKPKQLDCLYFCCPVLFNFDIKGSYEEVEEKIFQYLQSESLENPLQASCLIIYSKCKDESQLTNCINTLETLVTNLVQFPNEPKYRKIRLGNEKIRKNIVDVEGSTDFLKAIGFKLEQQPKAGNPEEMEPCLIISEECCLPDTLEHSLQTLRDGEPIKPILFRNTIVSHKMNTAQLTEDNLPNEFFRMSISDMKILQDQRRQQIEESGMLLTKKMRENLKNLDRRKYRYAALRILFPNNWILQGTFHANDKLIEVMVWIFDCLKVDASFSLSKPPHTKITDFEETIVDANLAPCSVLRLIFNNPDLNICQDKDENYFLKDALLA